MSSRAPIYLDHNATTPLLPDVVDVMLPYLRQHLGNPSSGHAYGQRAREAVERARGQVGHSARRRCGGRVLVEEARRALEVGTALLTVMHANNETGVLQPVAELTPPSHAAGALVHTDAAQSVGKVPVHVDALGVDLLSIAGHKLYAPKGVGALYVRRGTPIAPVLLGGAQERALRPGTENVASIVGLGTACEIAARTLE